MKKVIQYLVMGFLLGTFSLSTVLAQKTINKAEISTSANKVQVSPKSTAVKSEKPDVKTQLLKTWKFHEITLRTPKDGYLMTVGDKEIGMVNLLVANYTFNSDGSIALDEKYIEKQGVKEAKWELNTSGDLVITYYWTADKQKAAGFTNNYEKMEYAIDRISDKELSLNMSDMFIVNLIVKTKK